MTNYEDLLPAKGADPWYDEILAVFAALDAGKPDVGAVVLRGAEQVNIRDEGATGDGVTDDTAAIAAAFTKVAAGGVVFVPAGTYLMSAKQQVPAGVRLVGVPGRSILKAKAGSAASPLLLEITQVADVLVEGIVFDGNVTGVTNFNNVVVVYSSSRVVFRSCRWVNTRGIAVIFSTNVSYSGVLDSTFFECGTLQKSTGVSTDRRQAIAYSSGALASNVGNFVRGCTFNEVGLDCVSGSAQTGFLCADNVIVNNYAGGYYFSGSAKVRIEGNHVQGPGGNGVDVYSCDGVTVVGNTATGRNGSGIMLADTANALVVGNLCTDNWQSGESVHNSGIAIYGQSSACSNVSIVANRCTDQQTTKTQQYGVQVSSAAHTNIVIDDSNLLDGNAVAPIGGGGTYTPAAYTPTLTGVTVGNGTVAGVVRATRTLVQANGGFTLGSTSTINATVYLTVPATMHASIPDQAPVGTFTVWDSSAGAWRSGAVFRSGTQGRLVLADGTNLSASTPWTWAVGDRIAWSLSYIPA